MSRAKIRRQPKWIDDDILAIIHAQQIERYGGAHGVLDKKAVRVAVDRATNRWAHNDSADLADLAGVYLVAIAGAKGFIDGNKRAALACALVFLGLNGVSLHADPNELYTLTLGVATNRIGDYDVASWLRARMRARH